MCLHLTVPKETGIYLASGNTFSCTVQGFCDAFFYGLSVLMNAILAITYCILVKRGRRYESSGLRIVSESVVGGEKTLSS